MSEIIGKEARLEQLTGSDETLLAHNVVSETDAGYYVLAVRTWPHRTLDDAAILSLRYAYLTKGEGSDGWVENGINCQVPPGVEPAKFAAMLAETFAASCARLRTTEDFEPNAAEFFKEA